MWELPLAISERESIQKYLASLLNILYTKQHQNGQVV